MKEKPPMINAGQIGEIVGSCKQWWEIPALVAQAQRDADAAYYESILGEKNDLMIEACMKCEAVQVAKIQQAKADVAREIFEEIEPYHKTYRYALIAGSRKEDTYDLRISCEAWEGYKDKWLKESK